MAEIVLDGSEATCSVRYINDTFPSEKNSSPRMSIFDQTPLNNLKKVASPAIVPDLKFDGMSRA